MKRDYRNGRDASGSAWTADVSAKEGDRLLRVTIDGREREVEVLRFAGAELVLRVNGAVVRARVARQGERRFVQVAGGPPLEFESGAQPRKSRPRTASAGDLTASMHSQVVSIAVKEGDAVARGDVLVVLEAMKMESRITAPHAGRVKKVGCRQGEVVEQGRVLIEIEATG